MQHVIIYTDGACSGNPGPGGWAAVLIYGEKELEISGYAPETTNNRMELTAAIEALNRLKRPCVVSVYSDSAYLINAINQHWLDRWLLKQWVKSDGKPVENKDLWQKIAQKCREHQISWHKVKGHATDSYNNRCDQLATSEIRTNRNPAGER